MKQGFLLILTVVLLTAFAPSNRVDITWLNGLWEGVGYQEGYPAWTIEVDCNTKKERFLIRYPSLNCQGFWTVESTETNQVVFREKIAKGDHNCLLEGILVVTRIDDNYITYSFFEEIDGKRVLSSFSTLKKKLKK
jgi:hypothetical protein